MFDSFPATPGEQSFDNNSSQYTGINYSANNKKGFALTEQVIISDLLNSIENDELVVYYQPQIDINTGKTKSVEALVRWQHQTAGTISPDIFIPIAEKIGFITRLTDWVLNNALEQMNCWLASEIDLNISVNLSVYCFNDDSLPLKIAGFLEKWSIPPSRLTLEITEGVMIKDTQRVIRILHELRDIGVGLSLDDFGSGYSSLSYLSNLPINELKIDRSLIMDMENNSKNQTIVQSTIKLAKCLGLNVVAEGVENIKSYMNLVKFSCTTVQGYYFSKPVCNSEFNDWLYQSHWGQVPESALIN